MKVTKFHESLLNELYDGVYFVDRDRVITFWNKGAERITGFPADEVIGKSCMDNILNHVDDEGTHLCLEKCPLLETIHDGELREAEVYLHHKDGHRVPVLIRAAPVTDDDGQIIGGVEIFGDNSPRHEFRQRIRDLEKMAMLDALTGLPNRRYILDLASTKLSEFNRNDWTFGVMYFDIDHFKRINDTYGHDMGDNVLKMVSRTLEFNSRPYDIVGRWGGEEFVGIFPNTNIDNLEKLAARYRLLVKESVIFLESDEIRVTISIGATVVREGDAVETILQRADRCLYTSKETGRDRVTCKL